MTFNRIKRLYYYLVLLWITLLIEPSKSTKICNTNSSFECYCVKCKWPSCCNNENLGNINKTYIEFSLKKNSSIFNKDIELKWKNSIEESIKSDCKCTKKLVIISVFVSENFYRIVIRSELSQNQLLNSLSKTVFSDFSLVINRNTSLNNLELSNSSFKWDFTIKEWIGLILAAISSVVFVFAYFVSCPKACL